MEKLALPDKWGALSKTSFRPLYGILDGKVYPEYSCVSPGTCYYLAHSFQGISFSATR